MTGAARMRPAAAARGCFRLRDGGQLGAQVGEGIVNVASNAPPCGMAKQSLRRGGGVRFGHGSAFQQVLGGRGRKHTSLRPLARRPRTVCHWSV